jgi:dihydrofolate synthase/folylpolyglutamate synthase
MDHTLYLGDTLEAIAKEKFAAARAGSRAFYAGDDERLTGLFEEYCGQRGASPHILDRIAYPCDIKCDTEGTFFSYKVLDRETLGITGMTGLKIPLLGRHQAFNASRAITVLLFLKKSVPDFSVLNEEVIKRGLEKVFWPGRMEIFRDARGRMTMLDGAHNEHGARALVSSLMSLWNGAEKVKTGAVVFAVMGDKDFVPILNVLKELGCPIFCTELSVERSLRAAELEKRAKNAGLKTAGVFESPSEALAAAARTVLPGELTLCCGSLFLVGHLRKELKHRK